MAKYAIEFKLKVVKDYLSGKSGSLKATAIKYSIPAKSNIEKWVNNYQLYGVLGLEKKQKKKQYTREFKLSVLQYRKTKCISYRETANHFGIINSEMILTWQKKFDEEGSVGLERKPKGRPKSSMVRDSNKNIGANITKNNSSLSETERNELERLREENTFLKISLEYEKKLQALIQKERLTTDKRQK